MDNQVSEEISILRGVRQGDPISPQVFTATIQDVFKNAQLEEKGINMDGEKLSDLRCAGYASVIKKLKPQRIFSRYAPLTKLQEKTRGLYTDEEEESLQVLNSANQGLSPEKLRCGSKIKGTEHTAKIEPSGQI